MKAICEREGGVLDATVTMLGETAQTFLLPGRVRIHALTMNGITRCNSTMLTIGQLEDAIKQAKGTNA